MFFGSSNDSVASPSALASAARDTFAKTKAAGTRSQVAGDRTWALSPSPPAEIARIPGILRDEAQAVGAVFVDPIAEGWLATNPELIGSDGVHPNDAGHQYLAERIGPLIRDALQPSGGG